MSSMADDGHDSDDENDGLLLLPTRTFGPWGIVLVIQPQIRGRNNSRTDQDFKILPPRKFQKNADCRSL